jgi:hypothetical protein
MVGGRALWRRSVGSGQYFRLFRVLPLVVGDERVGDSSVLLDQEHRRPGDVPRVQADAVPDAEGAQHVAPFVDQDVEGQAGLFDVAAHRVAILREDPRDLDAARGIGGEIGGELTEPVAAVRSPGAPVKDQEQPPASQEIRERAHPPFLIDQRESGRAREG